MPDELIVDKPLFSPRRILRGMRRWYYLVVVCNLDIKYSLWYFIIYADRPYASQKAGKY